MQQRHAQGASLNAFRLDFRKVEVQHHLLKPIPIRRLSERRRPRRVLELGERRVELGVDDVVRQVTLFDLRCGKGSEQ